MKKHLLAVIVLFSICFSVQAQTGNDDANSEPESSSQISEETFTKVKEIDWDGISHNFGEIEVYEKVNHAFKFKNISKAPIIITDVKVTCGCTSPKWTQEPVMPGEMGEVSIDFNSWKDGVFSKTISVYTSAGNYPEKLYISALVIDPLKEEAPEFEEVEFEEDKKAEKTDPK